MTVDSDQELTPRKREEPQPFSFATLRKLVLEFTSKNEVAFKTTQKHWTNSVSRRFKTGRTVSSSSTVQFCIVRAGWQLYLGRGRGGRVGEQGRQRKRVCVGSSRSRVRALRNLSPYFYLRGHRINIKSGSEYIVCFHAVRTCESAQKVLRGAGAGCGRRVMGSRASPAFRPHHSHFTPYWSRRAASARQNKSKRG